MAFDDVDVQDGEDMMAQQATRHGQLRNKRLVGFGCARVKGGTRVIKNGLIGSLGWLRGASRVGIAVREWRRSMKTGQWSVPSQCRPSAGQVPGVPSVPDVRLVG
ncbi:hypothetical protein E4U38_005479 [Claviceps purpurea]|nr:hypothetical protein E4U38_005479 [Claviceps purpurea]